MGQRYTGAVWSRRSMFTRPPYVAVLPTAVLSSPQDTRHKCIAMNTRRKADKKTLRSRSDSCPADQAQPWGLGRLLFSSGTTRWQRGWSNMARIVARWWQAVMPVARRREFAVGSRCVTGATREANEDRCYCDHRCGVFLVADGMGGHVGGERASQTVIEVVASRLTKRMAAAGVTARELMHVLKQSVLDANCEMMELACRDRAWSGMGSTVVAGVLHGNRILVCSVGDSRAYLFRQRQLRQLTIDDTLVQGLVHAGALTAGEAARHPMRHVLLHSVGTRPLEKQLQVNSVCLRSGDRLLFASDGLTDAIDRDHLADMIAEYPLPQPAADALVENAQRGGSRDNITCIVVDIL